MRFRLAKHLPILLTWQMWAYNSCGKPLFGNRVLLYASINEPDTSIAIWRFCIVYLAISADQIFQWHWRRCSDCQAYLSDVSCSVDRSAGFSHRVRRQCRLLCVDCHCFLLHSSSSIPKPNERVTPSFVLIRPVHLKLVIGLDVVRSVFVSFAVSN